MKVDVFLADSVQVADGKLYALGAGWNILTVPGVPVRQPRIGIGAVVTVPYTDTNEPHRLAARLEDADGNAVPLQPPAQPGGQAARQVAADFTVGRPASLEPGDEQMIALAFNLDGLVFPTAGRYRFVLNLDGDDVSHLPFRVRLRPG